MARTTNQPTKRYYGFWVTVRRPQAPVPGTMIHEDEDARALGFKGALVGGPTHAALTIPALEASFGHLWFKSGAYSIRYFKPLYDGDEARVGWHEADPNPGDARKIAFWSEKRDGERVSSGWAALGDPHHELRRPWERNPPPPRRFTDDPLPNCRVGDTQPPFQCRPSDDPRGVTTGADYKHGGNRNLWYNVASPWGDPILSPLGISELTRQRIGPLIEARRMNTRTVMDAGFDPVVYGPLFTNQLYRIASWMCDKGRSERSVYWTVESTIKDETGTVKAIVRFKSGHLISGLPAVGTDLS